jgi:hypothetical protein
VVCFFSFSFLPFPPLATTGRWLVFLFSLFLGLTAADHSFFLFHFFSFFLFFFYYSISYFTFIFLFFLLFVYLLFSTLFILFPFFILSFLIFSQSLIFLFYEMRCKFVLARIISISGYKYLVRAIITTCFDSCFDTTVVFVRDNTQNCSDYNQILF